MAESQLTSNTLLLEVTNTKLSLCDLKPDYESTLNKYTSKRGDIKTEYRILQIEAVTWKFENEKNQDFFVETSCYLFSKNVLFCIEV